MATSESPEGTALAAPPQSAGLTCRGAALYYRGQPLRLCGGGDPGLLHSEAIDFEQRLADYAAQGLNYVRTWLYAPWAADYSPFYKNWEGKYDLSSHDWQFYDRLERFLKASQERGIVVHLTLFNMALTSKPEENHNPWNQERNTNGLLDLRRPFPAWYDGSHRETSSAAMCSGWPRQRAPSTTCCSRCRTRPAAPRPLSWPAFTPWSRPGCTPPIPRSWSRPA